MRNHRSRLTRAEQFQQQQRQQAEPDRRCVVVPWGSAELGEDLHAAARLGLLTEETWLIVPEKAPSLEAWAEKAQRMQARRRTCAVCNVAIYHERPRQLCDACETPPGDDAA